MTASVIPLPVLDSYAKRLGGLPAERFVGSILWYYVSAGRSAPIRVSRENLERWFSELNIDDRFLPPAISGVNAFRRACTESIPRTWRIPAKTGDKDDDQIADLHVVEIDSNDKGVLRHIVRRVRDPRTEQSWTATIATLRFHRGPRQPVGGRRRSAEVVKTTVLPALVELDVNGQKTGRTVPLSELDELHANAAVADFREKYSDLTEYYTADAVRGIVRDLLTAANAISVKPSGGVYFIHQIKQETVEQLEGLIGRIGQGCSFHQLPLLDTMDQRQMLTAAWEDEIETTVQRLLEEIAEVNEEAKRKGQKVSAARYEGLYVQFAEAQEKTVEYTDLLGLAQKRSGSSLELALEALTEMAKPGLRTEPRGKKRS